MGMGDSDGKPQVARVTVSSHRIVLSNSSAKLKCKMDENMPDYVIEPCENLEVFGSRVVPYMCVVNTADRYLTLKKGQEVGRTYPVESFVSDSGRTDENLFGTPLLPEHLRDTFERSEGLRSENQQPGLAQLLGSFEDVFAKNEFDLETFTVIKHTIDTGDVRPIK